MKLFLIIVLGVCFIYLGYGIKKSNVVRIKFWSELILFTEDAIREIQFFKSDFKTIAFSKSYGKYLDDILMQYFQSNQINMPYLSSDENAQIYAFLSSVGKLDVNGEVNNMKFYLESFKSRFNYVNNTERANYLMYSKLVALAGIVISIVFL